MAFQNYRSGELFRGPTTQWVGLKWFRMLFKNLMFGRLIRNTLLLSLYDLAVSFPLCVLLAVLR